MGLIDIFRRPACPSTEIVVNPLKLSCQGHGLEMVAMDKMATSMSSKVLHSVARGDDFI